MKNAGTLRGLVVAGLAIVGALGVAQAEVYEVTIENLIEGGAESGQPFTPPLLAVHNANVMLFEEGQFASAGLEALAEDGVTADLEAEANASPDVYNVYVGGGPFFGSETVEIEGNPGDLLSVVTMLARSNDLFTGINSVELPASGMIMIEPTGVYDAGTEKNSGLVEHIPFYGNTFVGPEQEDVISMVSAYTVFDDPAQGEINYEFPPSARVKIRLIEGTPAESETWGTIKSLFR